MSQWIKLSDLCEPIEFDIIHGAPALVAHINRDGNRLYEPLCVAKFDTNAGFFIAEDDIGSHAINPYTSGGEVYFYLIPGIPELDLDEGIF